MDPTPRGVRFAPEDDYEEYYQEEDAEEGYYDGDEAVAAADNDDVTADTTPVQNEVDVAASRNRRHHHKAPPQDDPKIHSQDDHNSSHNANSELTRRGKEGKVLKLICPNCGSTDIEQHEASGASICTDCAVVVEENAIVSSVEFVEGAGGAASAVGQFVSATSSKAYGSARRGGGRYGFSRDSRETTLANGRRRIQEVASRLRLRGHLVDSAHRHFTMAVEKNFVQGRRTAHVVASCLYMACRQEKNNQHMLIDFSDALQVNVYTLGTCFLKFRRLLGIKLELTDPALYVHRFAAFLDFGDKANHVGYTALRIVGRMNRDWLVAGRRPAGVCAAALLIAARAHGFSRTQADVTRVLRVCGMTVINRMKEFEYTPSAQLTLEQFKTVEIEDEADPPAFTRNRYLEARARAIQEGNSELLESGQLNHPLVTRRFRIETSKPTEKQVEMETVYKDIEDDLHDNDRNEEKNSQALVVAQTPRDVTTEEEDGKNIIYKYPQGNNKLPLVLPDNITEEEQAAPTQASEENITLDEFNEWKLAMPKSSEMQLESYFLDDSEVKKKEVVFNRLHQKYLDDFKRRQADKLNEANAGVAMNEDDAAQAAGHARYVKASSRSRRGRNLAASSRDQSQQSTEDALMANLASKRISRKINYDAMSALFNSDGAFTTENLEDKNDEEDKNEGDEELFEDV